MLRSFWDNDLLNNIRDFKFYDCESKYIYKNKKDSFANNGFLFLSAGLLAACGGSTTNYPERIQADPVGRFTQYLVPDTKNRAIDTLRLELANPDAGGTFSHAPGTIITANRNKGSSGDDVWLSDGTIFTQAPGNFGLFARSGGIDTLKLPESGTVNLNDFTGGFVDAITLIDTRGGGIAELHLSATVVSDFSAFGATNALGSLPTPAPAVLSETFRLLILQGDSNEAVRLTDTGWTRLNGPNDGILKFDDGEYNLFISASGDEAIAIREGREITQGGSAEIPLINPQVTFDENENNLIFGVVNADPITGGPGNNLLYGSKGNDIISDAGGERNLLFGSDGNDIIRGGPGNDFISGGAGEDRLSTGAGSVNWLLGGSESDTFYFNNTETDNADNRILDFRSVSGPDVFADKFAVESKSRLINLYREQLIADNVAPASINSFVSEFSTALDTASPIEFFRDLFNSTLYSFSSSVLPDSTGIMLTTLQISVTPPAAPPDILIGTRLNVKYEIQHSGEVRTIFPISGQPFANEASFADGVSFQEFVNALGGDDSFVWLA